MSVNINISAYNSEFMMMVQVVAISVVYVLYKFQPMCPGWVVDMGYGWILGR